MKGVEPLQWVGGTFLVQECLHHQLPFPSVKLFLLLSFCCSTWRLRQLQCCTDLDQDLLVHFYWLQACSFLLFRFQLPHLPIEMH